MNQAGGEAGNPDNPAVRPARQERDSWAFAAHQLRRSGSGDGDAARFSLCERGSVSASSSGDIMRYVFAQLPSQFSAEPAIVLAVHDNAVLEAAG